MKLLLVLLVGLVSCEVLQPEVDVSELMPEVDVSDLVPEDNVSELQSEVNASAATDLIQDEAELFDEDQFKKVMHDEDALLSMVTKADPRQVRKGLAWVDKMIRRAKGEIATLNRIKKLFKSINKPGGSILYKAAQRGFKKNNLIAKSVTVAKEWRLSFQVYQKGRVRNWGSIIHFTQGKDGSRLPAVWFYPNSNKLFMCMWTKRSTNDCWGSAGLAYNRWHTIIMTQRKLPNGKYQIRYIIDGKQKGTKAQGKPQVLKNVKVYSSDPWYSAPNALIKNINMVNL